jgi:hypothetical protein
MPTDEAAPAFTNYERRLARRVLEGEQDADWAALALFDRYDPASPAEAASLVETQGKLSREASERVAQAFDAYWHLREMPSAD